MPINAVIFDLDETLLDTSAVREDRERQNWTAVKTNLHRVQPFTIAGTEIHTVVGDLRRQGRKVGIVTHSPGWYVDELIDRFGIRVDATISGSDGYPPKPDPTSLKAISTDLGVELTDCVYVGDLDTDAAAAAAAGATSIGVCWSEQAPEEWRRWWPDVAISRPSHLLDLDVLDQRGPLGEVALAGLAPAWHWGTVMRIEPHVRALGRYFTPEDVDRHPDHALSQLVLAAKNDAAAARRVSEIFAMLAERPAWRGQRPELIVSVPPKPDQDYDRFEVIRAATAEALGANNGSDVLTMRFDVPNYKGMNHDERRHRNRGRFQSRRLNEEHVLLVDDVVTSGGQAAACRAVLLAAGAAQVGIIALSATQNRLPEGCPVCGAHLRIYRRRSDGRQFVGCPAYFVTGCPYTRDA